MFSDPIKNVEQAGIRPGMDIADFGAGSGHYSIEIGKALASTGRVYAVDVNKDLLTKLKNHAVKQGLYNIEVIWGDIDKIGGSKLRDYSVDMVFMCNIMFQLQNKVEALREVKRVLKPGGFVFFVDWSDSFGGLGPKKESVFTKAEAQKLFEKEGFHQDREVRAGSHHYGFIFKKL